uniref:Putative trypsin-like serine protease n=1 Tax=Xenopsylla cheopis TaxID=163159 RepID=A0A6M2E3L2_XENCH
MSKMWKLLSILAVISQISAKIDHRIVGGEDVDISTCGWQVSFQENDMHFCGGSIIDKEWILTAAHCVQRHSNPPQNLTVRVGSSLHNTGGRTYNVMHIEKHPRYNERASYDFDIALLKISKPISYTACTTVPVTLADSGREIPEGTMLSVTGWGATEMGGPGSITLQGVKVPAVSRDECNRNYTTQPGNEKVTDSMLCAGYSNGGKDSCQGDSGGPIVDENRIQVGVVSWGDGCALPGKPGVYAKVSHPDIISFIEDTIRVKYKIKKNQCKNKIFPNGF